MSNEADMVKKMGLGVCRSMGVPPVKTYFCYCRNVDNVCKSCGNGCPDCPAPKGGK